MIVLETLTRIDLRDPYSQPCVPCSFVLYVVPTAAIGCRPVIVRRPCVL